MALVINRAGDENGIAYSDGNEFVFELKELLKAQGWTVPRSGDGSTYNSGGDEITISGSGAGGMDNTRSWFEITSPDNAHNMTFQNVFGGYSWRVKYSENAFSGGTPDANETGSAADEQVLSGTGTDASPGGESLFIISPSARYMNVAVEDEAPYRFWANGHVISSGVEDTLVFVDRFIDGSFDASDPWPFVVGAVQAPNESRLFTIYNCWTQYAGVWQESALLAPAGWGDPSELVRAGGTDPISGGDIPFPAIWGRSPTDSVPVGWRGVSGLFEVSLSPRNNADTADRDSTRDRIYIAGGALSAAWNGTVPAT